MTQSVRIFYGLLAAHNSAFLGWALNEMNNAPHFLPEWIMPFTFNGNWIFLNSVFLLWIVIAAVAAAFPQSRVLRLSVFLFSFYCTGIIYFWHGLWFERLLEPVLCLLLIFGSDNSKETPRAPIWRDFTPLAQLTVCVFVILHVWPRLLWPEAPIATRLFCITAFTGMLGTIYWIVRDYRRQPNFALAFTLVILAEYLLGDQVPSALTPIVAMLWYEGHIQGKLPRPQWFRGRSTTA